MAGGGASWNLFLVTLFVPVLTAQGQGSELRIVLVGKTGAGKSATGNTILGEAGAFAEAHSADSVTASCQRRRAVVGGRNVFVVDTPGLFDTNATRKAVKERIEACAEMSVPGPHAFLLVVRMDVRFTEEEKNAVRWVQDNFGEDSRLFTLALFTHADRLTPEERRGYVKSAAPRRLIQDCGGWSHALDNTAGGGGGQVERLLEKIDAMVDANGGGHYTNEMYEKVQRRMREEEERAQLRMREEEERKKRERLREEQEEEERKRRERRQEEEEEEERKRRERLREEEEERKRRERLREKQEEEERIRREEKLNTLCKGALFAGLGAMGAGYWLAYPVLLDVGSSLGLRWILECYLDE